ncbi:MAG: hypothetical protein GTO12_15660 [Proteobacteria bacterium]|nr:hypothetical protein [Pseudomonadota bacterium]
MAKPRRRSKRVLLQLFIVIIVIAVLLIAAWFILGQNMLAQRQKATAPEQLGDLQLIGSYERFGAPVQISELLGDDIEIVRAYTAVYIGGNKRVIIWIGTAESSEAAAELVERMSQGVEKGGSGFETLQQLNIAGCKVVMVNGTSGEHFFYESSKQSKRIVWVTIEASDTLSILEQAVKSF